MPDEYAISDLTLSSGITNNDLMEISTPDTSSETGYSSVSATVIQMATKMLKAIQFTSDLNTTDKTIIGAINEILASGGASIMYGTTAPTAQQGSNGNLYVQYTAGTGGASDIVDALYVKLDGAWCEIETGGGSGAGGHTIIDDSGTSLTQRTKLQFKGVYSEDNSTDDTTEIDVVREMTKAQFDQLSAAEKTGFINTTDETSQINATEIPITSGSATNTKSYIDSGLSGKADISTTCKYIQTTITWNANTNRFDIPSQSPKPVQPQQCLIGRNSSNGSIYALWYVSTDENFALGAVISGSAPTSNQACYVNYVVPNT